MTEDEFSLERADLQQRIGMAEVELADMRRAFPMQKGLREMVDNLEKRLQFTGGATFLTKEEVDLLHKAIPCSRASW